MTMAEDENKCLFCGSACEIDTVPNMHSVRNYRCKCCGIYLLDDFFMASYHPCDIDKFKMACVLNERRLKGFGWVVLSNKTDKERKVCDYPIISVDELLEEFPKKASEFLNRALLNLSRLPTRPFEVIKFDEYFLYIFTPSLKAGNAFLRELAEQGFIRFNEVAGGLQRDRFSLTTKFWETVENLQKIEVGNKRAFVAMWFDKSMDDYYEDGIKKAIEDAGYVPIRIDLKEFNNKICDELIAEIKRSKFLIADFSGLRSGVFFEAGFAKGLGREVIFIVRKTDVEKLKEHFDTRQYNHIVYDSPEDLRKKLFNRIGATIV
jgi:DNA-binding PadR family transcriptional regulator